MPKRSDQDAALSPFVRGVAWIVGGFGVSILANALQLRTTLGNVFTSFFVDVDAQYAATRLYWMASQHVVSSYAVSLACATIAGGVGLFVRSLARARVRAGFPDALDDLRRWAAAHPRSLAAVTVGPAVLWMVGSLQMLALRGVVDGWDTFLAAVALPAALVWALQSAMMRAGLRALLAPTLSATEARGDEVRADGLTFDAVAVTPETVGAVALLAAISVVMAVLAFVLPTPTLVRSPGFLAALVGYLVLAVGGAALFRRASRICVGLDGIYVSGTARRRFIPFHEVDGARVSLGALELFRGERVVLRLQLHGEDALRRDALAARVSAAIAVADAQRNEPAADFVRSASSEALHRAAGGVSSYRESAPSREQLWQMLESPAIDAEGRKAAAAALARGGDTPERVRLRVAAEQCAEPSVRARIMELLEGEEAPPVLEPLRARLAR